VGHPRRGTDETGRHHPSLVLVFAIVILVSIWPVIRIIVGFIIVIIIKICQAIQAIIEIPVIDPVIATAYASASPSHRSRTSATGLSLGFSPFVSGSA
jgi:hypothetical protein